MTDSAEQKEDNLSYGDGDDGEANRKTKTRTSIRTLRIPTYDSMQVRGRARTTARAPYGRWSRVASATPQPCLQRPLTAPHPTPPQLFAMSAAALAADPPFPVFAQTFNMTEAMYQPATASGAPNLVLRNSWRSETLCRCSHV